MSSSTFSRRLGWTEARPIFEYILSKSSDMRWRETSATRLMILSGWSQKGRARRGRRERAWWSVGFGASYGTLFWQFGISGQLYAANTENKPLGGLFQRPVVARCLMRERVDTIRV